ncbi:MAG TPA: FAD-dependent oxidoreductase [Solirubrobacterales bacterium]|nr:FAD-dependent oxidoreductase [Solirubrobacterales bacterium]
MSTAAATETNLGVLFEPQQLGSLQLPNRIVMAPMGTSLDRDGQITDEAIAYYVRRARGGVGTITVEGCLVSPDNEGPEPKINSRKFLPGLSRLATALRDLGVVAGVQLMQPGRQVLAGRAVGPSPIPVNSASQVPHELSVGEIDEVVADYARAASLAMEAGFQFVEVHGAHGYLPSNFLSPLDNQREDGYGGSFENRARFSLEVARAIVAAGGDNLPLVWRLNGDDGAPGGFNIDEAAELASLLEREGAASISVSAGTWRTLHITLAPMFVGRGAMLPYARRVSEAVSVPVMAVGRLDDPAVAAAAIEAGDADLICIGRGLIAEPDWTEKVQRGRLKDVRPCIACNACVDLVGRGEPARCSVNPEVGREYSWQVDPAPVARDVMIVGSGPAGMEAARIAALRGHRVSIWERDEKLGGKLEVAGLAPSKREVLRFRDYQVRVLEELGVEAHPGSEVTADLINELRPDVVVVAAGAEPLMPPIPGLGGENVCDALAVLDGSLSIRPGERLAVVGGSATGCETAELAAAAGAEVTILELKRAVGDGIEPITRRHLIKVLRGAGVQILTRSKVVMIEPDQVLFEDEEGETHPLAVDRVALALGWTPRGDAILDALTRAGVEAEVHVLGDAKTPADFVAAINAGADAGLEL